MNGSGPIRILHIIDKLDISGASIHGITQALKWWIPRFDKHEFEFTVCSLRAQGPGGKFLEREGITVLYLGRGKFSPMTLFELLALIRQERPHVLHLHGYGAANFGRLASWITKIPNIVHEHVVLPNQPFHQTVADTILSPLTSKAIAISRPVRDFMVQRRKVSPARMETFFYGLPLAEFTYPDEYLVKAKRKELNITSEESVISTIGRLANMKGQIYFIRAAAEIVKSAPQTRFLVVGDGPDFSLLQQEAQRLNLGDRLVFTGFCEDVPVLLALSDIVVIPSIYGEGGPLTLFEAMNIRKPVVGTTTGMMDEVITHGETGFIIPPKDVSAIVEKLLFLLQNPLLAKQMGEKGWEVCQYYDIAYSVKRLAKIYQELFSSS
ncbi:MAG: glycosyl transferase [Nitrospirales bacterium]|nr:MAG: glycosyl transferase [Nitrospirales bacterium]